MGKSNVHNSQEKEVSYYVYFWREWIDFDSVSTKYVLTKN